MPHFASFQNLTTLEVKRYQNLMNFVTSSTAKCLVWLVKMRIMHYYLIEEVVENQEDQIDDKIIFSKLECLSLESLPSLTSFCSGNYTLEFPSLEKLTVEGCHEMKIFSRGVLSMPTLQIVKINRKSIEPCQGVDLNITIQQLYEKEVVD